MSATKSKQQNERGGRKRKLNNQELNNLANGANDSGDASESHEAPRAMPFKFVVRSVFKNVSKMKENEKNNGRIDEHFGVKWYIDIRHAKGHLDLFLCCDKSANDGKWSIDAEFEFNVVHKNKKSVFANIKFIFGQYNEFWCATNMNWEDLLKDYVVNDEVKVEAHVNINKTTGIYKNNSRSFDETMNDVSSHVFIVKNEKFYVSKYFLAAEFSVFKVMFFGPFAESTKSEHTLSGINSEDFQKYLEVLYGHATIDELTVEGILSIADMYDTPVLVQNVRSSYSTNQRRQQGKNSKCPVDTTWRS